MKKATFRDVETLRRARRERAQLRADVMTAKQTSKTIEGYRIQPMLPIQLVSLGGLCTEADFVVYDNKRCVEAFVKLGLLDAPYTVVLSIEQALEADIIERVDER